MPRSKRLIFLNTLIVATAVGLSGCSANTPQTPPESPEVPATATTLLGSWVTGESYRSPDQPQLTFATDATWSGSDGCNSARGTWLIDSRGNLTVTSAPQTRIYCDGAQLPTLLNSGFSAVFRGKELVILNSRKEEILKLKEQKNTEKPAQRGTDSVIGRWRNTEPGRGNPIFLNLTDEGLVTGDDGCNTLTGTWRFAPDGAVSFSEFSLTKTACTGVVTWLNGAASAVLDGSTMAIRSQFGAQLGTLIRTE